MLPFASDTAKLFRKIFSKMPSGGSERAVNIITLQKYPVNAGVPKGSILGPTLLPLYINDFPNDVICNIVIYANDTTLSSKCDQESDLWQQLELTFELKSDL